MTCGIAFSRTSVLIENSSRMRAEASTTDVAEHAYGFSWLRRDAAAPERPQRQPMPWTESVASLVQGENNRNDDPGRAA